MSMDVLAHLGRIMEARMTMHAGGVSWKTGHNTVWFGSHSSFKEKKAYLKKDASTNGALTE